MVNNNRSVENAWNLLQLLYDELRSRKFKSVDIHEIDSLDNLYAVIISQWCNSLATEGLYKEYVVVEDDELTSPMGEINIQETISRQTMVRGALICSYDKLSGNILINQVLKATLEYLLSCDKVDSKFKNDIKKILILYGYIDAFDIKYIRWSDIRFNNNNARYKHLIEVCKTLMSEHKLEKNLELDDNKRLFILFKKAISKWFIREYPEEEVFQLEVPFILENESPLEMNINKMQKLIAICTRKEAVVFCVRLQDEQLLEDSTLGRKHKEILVQHLREFARDYKLKVNGCVIYVNTDKTKLNMQPITMNVFNDYVIGDTTIDIHDQWRFTENKLREAYKYFIGRFKSNRKKNNSV